MSRKKTLLLLGASGALAIGVAAPAVAFAADSTPSPTRTSTSAPSAGTADRHGADRAAFAEALAKELGIDQQKVTDALAKVREQMRSQNKDGKKAEGWSGNWSHGKDGKDGNWARGKKDGWPGKADWTAALKKRLDEAVKASKITQAEADAILKASEAGVLGGGHAGQPAPSASSTPTK